MLCSLTRCYGRCHRCSWSGRQARGSVVTASVEYAMRATQLPPSGVHQRLPELLFTEVLRIYLKESGDRGLTGWLAALRDPIVGPALSLLHTRAPHMTGPSLNLPEQSRPPRRC